MHTPDLSAAYAADLEQWRRLTKTRTRTAQRIPIPVFIRLMRGTDIALMLLGSVISWVCFRTLPLDGHVVATLLGSWVGVLSLNRLGAYQFTRLRYTRLQLALIAASLLAGSLTVAGVLYSLQDDTLPGWHWPLSWALSAGSLLFVSRLVTRRLLRRWARAGRLTRRIAVVGATEHGRAFLERATTPDLPNLHVVGVYDDDPARVPSNDAGLAVAGHLGDLLTHSRNDPVDAVVVTLPLAETQRIEAICRELRSIVADVYVVADFAKMNSRVPDAASINGVPVLMVGRRPLADWELIQKATFDRICAALLLLPLAPVFLLLALLIKLDSRGPVLFRQIRIGFNNVPFHCYKFRTMYHHMSDMLANQQTTRDDPRVTRVGRWLRRFSLDELPQIFNVLLGDMSLVGPRPHAPHTKAGDQLFQEAVAEYAVRHRVKPGITGWAQVNGLRGETRTVEQIQKRVDHDIFYIENWSMLFDIKILLLTLLREINSRHAF